MPRLLLAALLSLTTPLLAADNGLAPQCLRCEYCVDPLGIDVVQPRLSWIVDSAERCQKQTAYRVLVAASTAELAADHGDLWDSGRVESGETAAVVYQGKPLASHQRCFWKVMVWDKAAKASAWSQPALWSMGILDAAGWKAQWIGYDKSREIELPPADMEGAKWIWHAADPANVPECHRLFVSRLTLPADAKVQKADLVATADDNFRFVINKELVTVGDPSYMGWKHPKVIDVAGRLRPGANDIRVEVDNAQSSPAGLIAKLVVKLADGKTVTLVTDGSWKSHDAYGPNWHMRDLPTDTWPAVRMVGDYGVQPWGQLKQQELILPPVPLLRTTFRAEKPVESATLYASALGLCDLYVNGARVSDDRFTPGWTDYHKRVYYRAYDVTSRIRQGENALGAALADGWFSGYIGWGRIRNHYGTAPRFLGQLHVRYTDGTTATIATGPDWKATPGPTLEADFLMGETYDARKELAGWDTAGFDASAWQPVVVGTKLKPVLHPHPGPAVKAYEEFPAQKITEPEPGVYVLNLGQNFAGVPRLTVSGEPGQKITLRFAERLNPNGTIYTTNLRGARVIDTYTCRGGGVETWQPRFTFHGFQYVEITGLKQPPKPDTVVGLALSSDTPVVAQFECSDPMINRLHKNAYYTQRSNFIDIPTDCPQRDERLGWTGDAQVYVRTATQNTDVQAFFAKWLVDLEDAQRADGQFPMVAPVKVAGDDGGPAWADAGVICPWTVYEVYNDRRLLEKHYVAMTRFIDFCTKRSTPELLPPAKFHCFGDWLSINANTPTEVIFLAYFAYSTRLTAKAAEALGHADDAAKYQALFDRLKAAFNHAYVANDGRIKGNTQACYVLALAFDLLDPEKQKLAAKYLVEDIESRGNHLSTGFIGTKDLMLVLAKIGRNDVAYRLLHNDTFPSWGFSIKHGATSIWERWDGWTPEKGFQDPGMNSFAHYSFGAVYQWIVENVGGIRNAAPGYGKIVVAPEPGGKLTSAKVGYRSLHGQIESSWKRDAGRLTLDVVIPANTTAEVRVPAVKAADVTESGKPLAQAEGVKVVSEEAGHVVVAIGSGRYQFAAPAK